MRGKVAWMAVVVASLSLMLCAGGCTAEAQSASEEARQPAAASEVKPVPPSGQTPTPAEVSELWNSMSGLRAEVRQLRQEVSKLRTQVGAQAQGTGGSGTQARAGSAPDTQARGTGGAGTAPRQVETDVPPAGSNVPAPTGTAVVMATFTGAVRSVAPPDVVIAQDSGEPLTLEVTPRTRVLRNGKSVGLRDLDPGDRVSAVVDMVGEHETVEISVLRKEDPDN
ncbi:hypothetical protein HUA78_43640 [Myxococcus sp. CA033]|uniref:hypothetical protein n=1 Tax=Myxococcus sp. CA033 TaxID=2741516 RepID=UPI00157B6DC8|nr:hypothetical protein [Myxococcus sp. CA033]NTX41343.1 hypothetical protein [Myxococcus sp. CA033]